MHSSTDTKRHMTFWLAEPERRLLVSIAGRLPRGIRPNHLSALGVFGAVGSGCAYALTTTDLRWLWFASLMLVVNWFGDSLDGTLARVRKTERPRYGYYLDHVIDAFNTAVVGIGIGLSPFVEFELALGLVIVYLVLSINVYLESSVFGVFRMAYGRIGPTEGRILLVLANGLLLLGSRWWVPQVAWGSWAINLTVAGIGAVLVTLLSARFAANLRRLARLEPS